MNTLRAALVVVNYGGPGLLAANLLDLATQAGVTVVVVDNFSGDSNRSTVAEFCHQAGWELLAPSENLGFGAGANLGVEKAWALGAQVVCLLNPDATMSSDHLRQLFAAADADRTALVAPRIVNARGNPWFTGAAVDVAAGRTTKSDIAEAAHPWLTGACLTFHADAWRITGGFAHDYFLYWEDVDLSWRHVAAGGSLRYRGDITVSHAVSATHSDGLRHGRSSLYYYFNCRNRLLFAVNNLDRREQRRWALHSASYASEVLLRGGRRQFLRPWRPVAAAVRGTLAGLARMLRSELADRRKLSTLP